MFNCKSNPRKNRHGRSGAFGKGVMQTVWTEFIQKHVVTTGLWVDLMFSQERMLQYIAEFEWAPKIWCELKFIGFVIRMGFQWGLSMKPISPILVAMAMQGPEVALSPYFLSMATPKITEVFSSFPQDVTALGQNPINLQLFLDSGASSQTGSNYVTFPYAIWQRAKTCIKLYCCLNFPGGASWASTRSDSALERTLSFENNSQPYRFIRIGIFKETAGLASVCQVSLCIQDHL